MITKEDITLLLSSLMDYNYKDYKYELIEQEKWHIGQKEIWLYIVKYNYIELMNQVNDIASKGNGVRREEEIDIILRNSLQYTAIRVSWYEFNKDKDSIYNKLFENFIKSLDSIATPMLIRNKKIQEIEDKYIPE